MNSGILTSIMAIGFLFGHLGLIPFAIFYPTRLNPDQTLTFLLIIGPMTAAYMITVTNSVIEGRFGRITETPSVNPVFALFSLTFLLAFFISAYGVLVLSELRADSFDPEAIKKWIGAIEIFVGGSFALIMKSHFPARPHSQVPNPLRPSP